MGHVSQKLWKFISLLLFLENNSIFLITRGRLVTFFSCSQINIAGNNELCIRKEDVVKWSTELRKMWSHKKRYVFEKTKNKHKKMRIWKIFSVDFISDWKKATEMLGHRCPIVVKGLRSFARRLISNCGNWLDDILIAHSFSSAVCSFLFVNQFIKFPYMSLFR